MVTSYVESKIWSFFDWEQLYVDGLKNYFVVIDYIFHNFTQIIEYI